MITPLESADDLQNYLQNCIYGNIEPEVWKNNKNIDVFGIIKDEIIKGHYFEKEYYQNTNNIRKMPNTPYNLDCSPFVNFIKEFKAQSPGIEEFMKECFKNEQEYIRYQQDYLLLYAQAILERNQVEVFNKYINKIVIQWMLKAKESNFEERKIFLIREIELFKDLLAGKTTVAQAELLEIYYKIHDWKDIYDKYDKYLRSKQFENSTDFYQSDNNAIAQAIPKYIHSLETLLNEYTLNESINSHGIYNTNNLLSESKTVSIKYSDREQPKPSSSNEKRTSGYFHLQWKQVSPIIAEKQLRYLYNNLISPSNTEEPYIDCTYDVFEKVMRGNIETRIDWIGCKIHLMWLIKLLRENQSIIAPKHYLKATGIAFAWTRGNSKKTKYKSSNYDVNNTTKAVNEHYSHLQTIVMNVMKIK